MSGYIRTKADGWEAQHYSRVAWLGREKCAPAWWIDLDVAWHVDRRKLPSAREAAEHWCVDKNKAARLIREGIAQQVAWEARADRKAAITRLLEEWASKEPKRATASRIGTGKGQGVSKGDGDFGTGDTHEQHIVEPDSGQERDSGGTGDGQGRDTSRASSQVQPPTDQPPVLAPAVAAAKRPRKPSADKPPAHPYHQRVIDAWDRVHVEATRGRHYGGDAKAVFTGHEIRMLTQIRDDHVPRTEGPDGDAAMQRVGAAFRRYVAEALAGRAFPAGPPTVRGFSFDSAAWFGPEGPTPHKGPATTRGRTLTIAEMLAAANEPEPRPDAHDTTWRTA